MLRIRLASSIVVLSSAALLAGCQTRAAEKDRTEELERRQRTPNRVPPSPSPSASLSSSRAR